MQEPRVWFIGQEDSLKKENATPVFLPGELHGQRSLAGYSPWSPKRVEHYLTTEQQQYKEQFSFILPNKHWLQVLLIHWNKVKYSLYPLSLNLPNSFFYFFFIFLIFISWRLITLQYCSGFCHTLKWISHGFTCVPHPDPPSHLPLHPIPLGLPSAPGPSACLMHPTWAGDLFHPR